MALFPLLCLFFLIDALRSVGLDAFHLFGCTSLLFAPLSSPSLFVYAVDPCRLVLCVGLWCFVVCVLCDGEMEE